MVDPRPGVAKETAAKWLNATFTVPLSMRSEVMAPQRDQRSADIHDAVLDALPRDRDRMGLLALCEAVRKRLLRGSKAATWPTVAEVAEAFRTELDDQTPQAEGAAGGWPHRNTEHVIESTARWLRKFNDWPNYLEHPQEVARALVSRGEFTMSSLIRAGYRATAAERKEAGIVHAPAPDVEPQRMLATGFEA